MNIKKSLLVLTVFGLSVAGAKSYDITLDNTAKAGSVELKPGKYSLSVDNSMVHFKDANSGKSVEAQAKVETSDKKFNDTLVNTKQVNGTMQINEIDLGGTRTKITFE